MRDYLKDLDCIARTLSEQQVQGFLLSIVAVDIEVDEEHYFHFERMIHDDVNAEDIKYIKATVSLENGRMRGYIRVRLSGFTFNIFRQQKEEPKYRKPHSRYY